MQKDPPDFRLSCSLPFRRISSVSVYLLSSTHHLSTDAVPDMTIPVLLCDIPHAEAEPSHLVFSEADDFHYISNGKDIFYLAHSLL